MSIFNWSQDLSTGSQPATGEDNTNSQQQAGSQNEAQTATAERNTNTGPGTHTNPTNPATGSLPPANAAPTDAQNPNDVSLDNFAKLLHTTTKGETKENPLNTELVLPADELEQLANSSNFTGEVTEEMKQALQNGDAETLVALVNAASQQAYKQTLQHMSVLMNQNLDTRLSGISAEVQNQVHSSQTSSALAHDAQSIHPLVQQELNRVATDIRKANPNASPEEVADGARKYMEAVANNFTKAQQQANTPQAQQATTEIDYSEWMGMKSPNQT